MVTTPVGLAIGRQRLIDGSEEIGSPRHGDVAVFESGGLAGYSLEMRDGWPAWVATTATNSDPDIVCIKDLANGLGVLTMPSGRSYLCCAGQRHRLLVVSIDAGAPRDVVAELAMPTAINSVAVDASGTRLVACGDRSALYIVTVEEADNGTSLTLTLEDTIDSIGIGWGQVYYNAGARVVLSHHLLVFKHSLPRCLGESLFNRLTRRFPLSHLSHLARQ